MSISIEEQLLWYAAVEVVDDFWPSIIRSCAEQITYKKPLAFRYLENRYERE